ncbi:glycosyltransferase [Candidatus Pacebacteria bacterium]|nr:glycosyltransferase [Candidatus Paceibacterota bacterium]
MILLAMQHDTQSSQVLISSQDISIIRKSQSLWRIIRPHFVEGILLIFFFTILTGLILIKSVLISSDTIFSSFWVFYGFIVSVFLFSRIPYAYLYEDTHDVVYRDQDYLDVSVIVTAKNEGDEIYKTITHVLTSNYPGNIECIVINDGSTDNTEQEILRAQRNHGEAVKLISFEVNRGKREAMNVGIQEAQNEILVFIDSDSYVQSDGIRHIAEHFLADTRIGAVSGNTKVENRNAGLMAKMQSIQYAISFDVYKASESVHRSVTCCPGCFSAYRRRAIVPLIEGWKNQAFLGSRGNFGDDRALTNFVLRKWDVIYCEKARATTIVPIRFSVYWRQQLRWKKSWIREGVFGAFHMWKCHPLASLGFYIHFSFPFLGPILALNVLIYSIMTKNPLIFPLFMVGFMLIGMIFALFVRLYRRAKDFMYMPLFSALFVLALIWQMPYALLTVRKNHWGTR